MAVLLVESQEYKKFYPVSQNKFLWDITVGMFTPLQRYNKQFHDVKVYSPRFEDAPFSFLKADYEDKILNEDTDINTVVTSQFIPYENLSPQIGRIGITKEGRFVYLRSENISQDTIERIINGEIESLLSKYQVKEIEEGIYLNDVTDIIKQNAMAIEYDTYVIKSDSNFISPNDHVYIDKNAKIQQFVSLQAENGPIVIDKGALIRSFSIIDGPTYIGKNSIVDSAMIRGGTSIKEVCKIGGEVEGSIIESYSNKHHEGFIGHSYIGSWVNIGAMTTTSDLKNNYGNVRIQIESETIDTQTDKFGSIICDYSKLGIGMMLNTGTVIGAGCNLFLDENSRLPKYVKAFSWGESGQYEIDKFIEDLKKMMQRRNQTMSEGKEKLLREFYKSQKIF